MGTILAFPYPNNIYPTSLLKNINTHILVKIP